MSGRINALADIAMRDPAVDTVDYWIGANPTVSQGRIVLNLKPLNRRTVTAAQVLTRLRRQMASVEGIIQGMQVRQDIQVGGLVSAAQYQYTLQDPNVDELYKWSSLLEAKLGALPQLRGQFRSASLGHQRDAGHRSRHCLAHGRHGAGDRRHPL
jgi:multidrug efflux pump